MNRFDYLPAKEFFTLKEACAFKNLNYKTCCNKTRLQPPNPVHIGGKRVYSRQTIQEWLPLDDTILEMEHKTAG